MSVFETGLAEGVLQIRRPGTRWLSTGWDGGERRAEAAYNVSVPDGWERTDVGAYVDERLSAAGFEPRGPTLLTGVEMRHARGARLGPVEAIATAGLSNPASLSMEPEDDSSTPEGGEPGTVNVIVGTTRKCTGGALAGLLAAAAEAKTATLLAESGFTGTTTDALVVACDPEGESIAYAGSATSVGNAARACVREAVRASLGSRYADRSMPKTVADAAHGVVTSDRASVYDPGAGNIYGDGAPSEGHD